MNNEDEGTRANFQSHLKDLGITEEEIISITNFVDDYQRRHKPKYALVVTVSDAVELLTDNSLILIRGTTDFGDPLRIKKTKPDTTFSFFDQYSLEGIKRALSSPYTGEALQIDDLVSLNEFIQASLLHDFVIHGDLFLLERESLNLRLNLQ